MKFWSLILVFASVAMAAAQVGAHAPKADKAEDKANTGIHEVGLAVGKTIGLDTHLTDTRWYCKAEKIELPYLKAAKSSSSAEFRRNETEAVFKSAINDKRFRMYDELAREYQGSPQAAWPFTLATASCWDGLVQNDLRPICAYFADLTIAALGAKKVSPTVACDFARVFTYSQELEKRDRYLALCEDEEDKALISKIEKPGLSKEDALLLLGYSEVPKHQEVQARLLMQLKAYGLKEPMEKYRARVAALTKKELTECDLLRPQSYLNAGFAQALADKPAFHEVVKRAQLANLDNLKELVVKKDPKLLPLLLNPWKETRDPAFEEARRSLPREWYKKLQAIEQIASHYPKAKADHPWKAVEPLEEIPGNRVLKTDTADVAKLGELLKSPAWDCSPLTTAAMVAEHALANNEKLRGEWENWRGVHESAVTARLGQLVRRWMEGKTGSLEIATELLVIRQNALSPEIAKQTETLALGMVEDATLRTFLENYFHGPSNGALAPEFQDQLFTYAVSRQAEERDLALRVILSLDEATQKQWAKTLGVEGKDPKEQVDLLCALTRLTKEPAKDLKGQLLAMRMISRSKLFEVLRGESDIQVAEALRSLHGENYFNGGSLKDSITTLVRLTGVGLSSSQAAAIIRNDLYKADESKDFREILPAMAKLFEDPSPEVRIAAVYNYGVVKTPETAKTLHDLLGSSDPGKVKAAIVVLAGFGPLAKGSVQKLTEMLADPELELMAGTTLGNLGEISHAAIPALIRKLTRDAPNLHAAEVLAQMGPIAKDAIPVAIKMLEQGVDLDYRGKLWHLLARVGPVPKEHFPFVYRHFAEGNPMAIPVIEKMEGRAKAAPVALQLFAETRIPRYLHAAVEMDPQNDEVVATLIRNADVNYPAEMKEAAWRGLRKVGPRKGAAAIQKLVWNLATAGNDGDKMEVVETLGALGKGSKEAADALEGVLHDARAETSLRQAAGLAFSELGLPLEDFLSRVRSIPRKQTIGLTAALEGLGKVMGEDTRGLNLIPLLARLEKKYGLKGNPVNGIIGRVEALESAYLERKLKDIPPQLDPEKKKLAHVSLIEDLVRAQSQSARQEKFRRSSDPEKLMLLARVLDLNMAGIAPFNVREILERRLKVTWPEGQVVEDSVAAEKLFQATESEIIAKLESAKAEAGKSVDKRLKLLFKTLAERTP